MKALVAGFSLLLGGILMVLSLLGGTGIHTGIHSNGPHKDETFDAALAERTRSLQSLAEAVAGSADGNDFQRLSPKDKTQRIYEVVAARFTRTREAVRHTPYTNWMMWALGVANGNLSMVRDPDLLLRYTHSAYCGEIAYVMLRLTERFGIPSRHVGLHGHVVMESWYEGSWHLFDPYAEVVPRRDGRVLGVEEFSRDPALVRAAYASSPSLAKVYLDPVRTNFVAYPPGALFVWKADVLMRVERAAEWLKYVIPLAFIAFGLWLAVSPRHKRSRAA